MVSPELAGAVTGVAVVLLACAVGAAGGWRPAQAGGDPVPEISPAPERIPASLVVLAWRIRVAAELYRVVLLAALGLTPLGAGFVHLIAPDGVHWQVAAAMLVIAVAAWGAPRLLTMWWLRLARRTCPALVRRRPPLRSRIARLVLTACLLAGILADIAVDPSLFSGGTLAFALAVFIVSSAFQQDAKVRRLGTLPRPERLVTALVSLPGRPGVRGVAVAAGWRTPVANAAAISGVRRGAIVFAPPLLAALTDAQLRAVVAHELAHLRTRDTWWRMLRGLLMLLASAAAALTLYAIPALRRLAGVHVGYLAGRSLPLLLAVAYLAWKALRVAELRARRAEEAAADRRAVELTGDPRACTEAIAVLGSIMGTPESWTLPRRLLVATHPATGERLRLISSGEPAPRKAAGAHPALAALMVIALAAGPFALTSSSAPTPNLGQYRVVPPPRFENGVLAAQLGSSVWAHGIRRFTGAMPVEAVYDEGGQPWLYVWGAEGDLTDPAGELAAFWKATDPMAGLGVPLVADAEATGPLDGYLQCEFGTNMCAWADYSGIVVVSTSPPDDAGGPVSAEAPDPVSAEQALADLTKSFRGTAELAKHGKAR